MKPKNFSNRFMPRASALFGTLVLCHFTTTASATTYVWDGNGTGAVNLNVDFNWNPDGRPAAVAGDIGQFDGSVAGNLVLTASGPSAATNPWSINVTAGQDSSLTIDTPNGTNGMRVYNVFIEAGAFENAGAAFSFGNGSGTPILNLGSGVEPYNNNSFTNNSASTALIQSDIRFANGITASRKLTFDGTGNWTVAAAVGVTSGTNGSIGVIKGGSGALTLNGANTFTDGLVLNQGALNINTATALGAAASTFTIAGGSINNTSGAAKAISANNPQIWNADIAYGTSDGTTLNDLSLGAGAVSLGTTAGTSRTVNANGAGLLTVAGVISDGTTANSIIKTGTGGLKLDGTNTFTGGITLSAGILQLSNNAAFGPGTLTVNGGTIIPRIATRNVSNPVSVGGDFTIGTPPVGNQMNFSGPINLGGANRTITVEDTTQNPDSTFSGVVSNGGFIKSGAGTLVFSEANTYTGPTTISQGTLSLTNFAPLDSSSAITINGPGAKLLLNSSGTLPQPVTLTQGTIDGIGTINNLTVADSINNVVSAGNGAQTPLNIGSLTFQGAASLNLTNAGPFPGQQLTVTDLVTSPLADVVVTATASTGVWTDNYDYPLIEFTNYASSASTAHFTLTPLVGLNPSQTASLVNTGTAIVLRITTSAIVWTANSNANWTPAPVSGVSNWTPTEFALNKSVIFDDTAAVKNVNITANVSPSSTIFNNDVDDYTISSTGAFGIQTGSLTKNGFAKTTISTNNAYPGATIINGGILEFATPITSTSSVTINNASNLILDVASAYTYANVISGNGSVTKNGTAALTLTGANTFTGSLTLNAGLLNINSPSAIGAGPGALVINGGSFDNTSGAALTVTTNKPQTWNSDITFTGSNNLDLGTGTVNLGGEGDRIVTPGGAGDILTVGEIKSPTQGLNVTGGGTLVATSVGAFGDASKIGGTLTVGAGTTLQINRSTADGANTGDFVATGLAGTGTIISGALATERSLQINTTENHTFGGTIANGGAAALALNKQGTGILILTGASTYTGPTVIGGGILNVQNGNALGASRVSIVNRLGGLQIQGGITIPSTVTFLTSNDGLNAGAIGYAVASVSGDNVINGAFTMTAGGGFTIIQSDEGSTLTLNGNVTSDQARSLILHGASTGANTLNGILSNGTAGVNGLTKTGAGNWIVTAANTYTGVTTISEGTLQLGNGTTDGTISTTSSVVNNASLVYNWATSHTATYVISGTGSVTKNGAGTASLFGVNTYTGSTTINAGEIAVNGNSLADTGTLVINGGKLNLTTGFEIVDKLFFGGVQQPAGSYTATGDGTHFSGAGTLIVASGPGGPSGFSTWASNNGASGQSASDDHDNDGVANGVEFFVGATGSGFTALPSVVTTAGVRTVTWPKSAAYTGSYEIQVSADLGVWTTAPGASVTDNGTTVVFTFPTGPTVRFARLVVKPS